MAWIFIDGTRTEANAALYEMEYDGKDVWVTASGIQVIIFSYYGESDGDKHAIDLSNHLDDAKYIVKNYNTMYVFDNNVTQFVPIDIVTKTIGDVVTLPINVNSVPAFGYFKLWFVTDEQDDDDVQSLFYYDVISETFSTPVLIPGRHQEEKRKIVWGMSNYVFVTMMNESSLAKFSAIDGTFIAQIPTNRMPKGGNHLIVNDSREILVCGFNGMVSSVNQDTHVSTNIGGLNATADNFIDDGTYLWTVTPTAARIEKGGFVDNYLVMKEVPSVDDEAHTQVFFEFGFALNNVNATSLTLVKEGNNILEEGLDFEFGIDDTFAEQRVKILTDAPNVTGIEPLTITIDYSYNPTLLDYNILGFSDASFKQVLDTPEYTHEYWDDVSLSIKSITEPQRIVLLSSNAVYFAYNLTDSWALEELRAYELSVKGTALVGTGPAAYHGETQ